MNQYIQNLIPRLRQFSENLDRNEIYVDAPWVLIDEDFNRHKYIFRRNGELIMSLNGQVTIGRWEYLPAARSLLIDRRQDIILLNQNFIAPALMILKKDGVMDNHFILANEILLPDLNIDAYLRNLYIERNNIIIKEFENGIQLELIDFNGIEKGLDVSIYGKPVVEGKYQLLNSNKMYLIIDSKINKILINVLYHTNRGDIIIEQEEFMSYSYGDYVYQNNLPAPDGKYKLNFLQYIKVKNGRVIDFSIL